MSQFAPARVEYQETRSYPYYWKVSYDLGFNGRAVEVDVNLAFTGTDPGAQRMSEWSRGIDNIWNHKVFFSDGERLYEIRIDANFGGAPAHQTITVYSGTGRGDMDHWFEMTEWGPDYVDEFAAHEFGHMLGAFDEYGGGATLNGYTTYGSLMADFVVEGAKNFDRYVEGIRLQTETRSGMALQAQLSILGTSSANSLAGTASMDGFYGMGGADEIAGRGGNDFLDGGLGDDRLAGGAGHDILRGGQGADRFVFGVARASSSDIVYDFDPASDRLVLEGGAFAGLGPRGPLAAEKFFADSAVDALGATTPGQRLLYDTDSGKLWYDPDGSDPLAKMLIARLAGAPEVGAEDFRVL